MNSTTTRTILFAVLVACTEFAIGQPVAPVRPVVPFTVPGPVVTPGPVVVRPSPPSLGYVDPPLGIKPQGVPARKLGRDTFAGQPLDVLWQKILGSGGDAIIGIKAPGSRRGVWKATRLISRSDVESYSSRIESAVGVEAIVYRDPILPVVVARLASRTALEEIQRLPWVDYVEPANLELQSLSGCGRTLVSWASEIDPSGDFIPRTFPLNSIDRAWKRNVNGHGVNIGVVDTGLYRAQQQFWPERFSSVASGGRSMRYGSCTTQQCLDALPDSAFDECNHGTRIAGAIAAPKDGANIVGVAFRSNLHAVKVDNGVWSDPPHSVLSHLHGIRVVREAGARIIEMAFGGTFTSFFLADEISFQYSRTDRLDVLFVGAAGTGSCPFWAPVAFPARMPEVFAVTGVNRDGSLAKDICTGPEVDLGAVLEDFETTGDALGTVLTLGGSSGASALVAGIAALVWSQNPTMTRDQVRSRLQSTAWQSDSLGIGVVNAYAATGGVRSARILGPRGAVGATQAITLQAAIIGDGPFSYLWDRGETTTVVSRNGPGTTTVTVRDLTDSTAMLLSFTARPPGSTPRPPNLGDDGSKVCLSKPWLPGCGP